MHASGKSSERHNWRTGLQGNNTSDNLGKTDAREIYTQSDCRYYQVRGINVRHSDAIRHNKDRSNGFHWSGRMTRSYNSHRKSVAKSARSNDRSNKTQKNIHENKNTNHNITYRSNRNITSNRNNWRNNNGNRNDMSNRNIKIDKNRGINKDEKHSYNHNTRVFTECKLGSKCRRKDCTYLHTSEGISEFGYARIKEDSKADYNFKNIPDCKFGFACERRYCVFRHKSIRTPLCNSGKNCNDFGCRYKHIDSSEYETRAKIKTNPTQRQNSKDKISGKRITRSPNQHQNKNNYVGDKIIDNEKLQNLEHDIVPEYDPFDIYDPTDRWVKKK